jgi:hypothetical protein
MAFISLEQAKRQLAIADDDTSDDDELQDYCDSITTVVERHVGDVIDERSIVEERLLDARSFVLYSTPAVSLTSVATVDASVTWDVDNLHLNTNTGRVTVLTGPPVRGLVEIIYLAGYDDDDIPGNYVRGGLIILQHVWESQRGVAGVQPGVAPEEMIRTSAPWTIPHKALEWLGPQKPVVA